jgi:hypothetical protein
MNQKKELQKRTKEQNQIVLSVQKALASPDGKVLLKKLSQMCNENEPTFIDMNPTGTAYKEGQRSIIIGIRKMLNKNINEQKQGKAEL